jgi:hypothetical protein
LEVDSAIHTIIPFRKPPRRGRGPWNEWTGRPITDNVAATIAEPLPQLPSAYCPLQTSSPVSRLLIYLAVFALAILGLAIALGLRLGDLPAIKTEHDRVRSELAIAENGPTFDRAKIETLRARHAELGDALRAVDVHLLTGVGAALAVLLANSIAVTYFIGTNRWCREVCDAYSLGAEFVARSTRLKRQAFPWALVAMLSVVGVSLLGALSDPRVVASPDSVWPTIHFTGALVAAALIAVSFYVQWLYVSMHHALIGEVMEQVTRIRTERGLPV